MKSNLTSTGNKAARNTCLFLLICLFPAFSLKAEKLLTPKVSRTARLSIKVQEKKTKKPGKNQKTRVPRVGVIKDYPATGMMTGCNNLYFTFPKKTESTGEEYVYLAHADGDAWMNLDGRDTHLKYLKTKITRKKGGVFASRQYDYRAGSTKISVLITDNDRDDADYFFKMIITLRRGAVVRQVKAIGYADC